jgi:hypothetical protein
MSSSLRIKGGPSIVNYIQLHIYLREGSEGPASSPTFFSFFSAWPGAGYGLCCHNGPDAVESAIFPSAVAPADQTPYGKLEKEEHSGRSYHPSSRI